MSKVPEEEKRRKKQSFTHLPKQVVGDDFNIDRFLTNIGIMPLRTPPTEEDHGKVVFLGEDVEELSRILEAEEYQLPHESAEILREVLLEGGLRPFFDPLKGVSYPTLEEKLKMSSKEIARLLEELEKEGFLEKSLAYKLPKCPRCGAVALLTLTGCPKCGNTNITRESLVEHTRCGYFGSEESFADGVCPQCGGEIKDRSKDLRTVGSWFHCPTCNSRFSDYNIIYLCQACDSKFRPDEIELTEVYTYTINPAKTEELRRQLTVLPTLRKFLESHGFAVESPKALKGASGNVHRFDIVAWRDSEKWVFDVVVTKKVALENELVPISVKVIDVRASKAFVIAIPSASEQAKRMANLLNIEIIDIADAASLESKLSKHLAEPSSARPEAKYESSSRQAHEGGDKAVGEHVLARELAEKSPQEEQQR